MKFQYYKPGERGQKDIGWLKSNFVFSFSNFYDPVKAGFGLLRAFNDDFLQPQNGFGIHPHTNMEIISIMLAGSMNHIDSLGYKEVVHKDWVQIMSAGNGLRHEEHNVGEHEVNFLQIWIEPKLQNIAPRYQRRFFPEDKRINQLVTVVSNEEGQNHCWINQNAKILLGNFQTGQRHSYSFNNLNKSVFIFNISGDFRANKLDIRTREGLGFWETDKINFHFLSDSKFILIEVPVNH